MPLFFLDFSGFFLLVIFFLFSSFVAVDFDDLVFVAVDTVLLIAVSELKNFVNLSTFSGCDVFLHLSKWIP